jgi:serine/threonine protein kinase
MEYLEGEPLRRRLDRQGGLPLALALPIALQVAQALRYMHQREIIHCDVKSENLYLCQLASDDHRRAHIKLIDFGLSRYMAAGATLADTEVGGTPDYIAPEMILGGGPQPSVDIYALGVLLHEVITGRMPFSGSAKELLVAHLHQQPTPPSARLAAGLDPRVDELVLRLLSKRPVDRPESMQEVIRQLRGLMGQLGLEQEHPWQRMRRTDRIRLQTRQDHELASLRSLIDAAPVPLFRTDEAGAVLVANRAFCEFVALPAERLVGTFIGLTGLDQLYPYIGARLVEAVRRRAVEPLVSTATYVSAERGPITVRLTLVPEADAQGNITHFTGILHPLGA